MESIPKLAEIKEEKFDYAANVKDSAVLQFYADKSVLLTGATGFVGGVVLEKLLYCCEELRKIYVLIRTKAGETPEKRLEELVASPILKRIREEKNEFLKKIVLVSGDITLPELDLAAEDNNILRNEVSIVLHVAANVSFTSTLEDALVLNTKATQNVVQFSKTFKNLDALVYVSTAFSNINRDVIGETVYSTGCSLDAVYHMVDTAPANALTKNLLDNRPNTYTFAKALAEEYIDSEKEAIPACIVRPSVIISSIKDPWPGWVIGLSGANGIVTAIGQGLLRSWYGNPDLVADLIPVDVVANMVITAAWDTKKRRDAGDKQVKVFNCCSGLERPIKVKDFMYTSMYYTRKHRFDDCLWYPSLFLTKSRWLHAINVFFLHMIPAFFLDLYFKFTERKPRMVKIQRSIWRLASVLEFFTWHQYTFVDYNARMLHNSMSAVDKIWFNFNIRNLNWDKYLENYVIGLNDHVKTLRKKK